MEKTTFVAIIKAIQNQKEREEDFGKKICKVFKEAGESDDFRSPESFLPPTTLMIDGITDALAHDFVTPCQTYENALDLINYFMYELSMMNYQFVEPIDPKKNDFECHEVPAYIHQGDEKIALSTPEELYDALIYCGKVAGKCDTKEPDNKALSAIMDNAFDVWERVRTILNEMTFEYNAKLNSRFVDDLEFDSLDLVELQMKLEKEFSNSKVTFSEEYFMERFNTLTCKDLVEYITFQIQNKE